MTLRATFQRYTCGEAQLPRSSHSFNVVNGHGLLFGGEVEARKPVDPAVYSLALDDGQRHEVEFETIPASKEAPIARVGHTSAKSGDSVYVFGGRGGKDETKPMDEAGRVWRYNALAKEWTALDPSSSVYPSARSYHASTAAEDLGKIYIHAGCPASGRASDLWAFDFTSRAWEELTSGPLPPRGGPGLAYALGHLFRYGGFDGHGEQGGILDYLDVRYGHQQWQSVNFEHGKHPGGRSVLGLQAIKAAGQTYLIAFLGEKDASSQGHAGAGKFWDDVWALALSGDGKPSDVWQKCELTSHSDKPPARGWFASDVLQGETVVLFGGLNGLNERESDGFSIRFEKGSRIGR
ncbi:MAG: hypothetical protein CYPHOPRED_004994 [Cyphobasidiales sp. Tagirdzhanova-0007]|nr:MAG: hypothetical protein CYPHOPRED_004994 [Cyphobasidiales sp. Tagirdzhanova-0007]